MNEYRFIFIKKK